MDVLSAHQVEIEINMVFRTAHLLATGAVPEEDDHHCRDCGLPLKSSKCIWPCPDGPECPRIQGGERIGACHRLHFTDPESYVGRIAQASVQVVPADQDRPVIHITGVFQILDVQVEHVLCWVPYGHWEQAAQCRLVCDDQAWPLVTGGVPQKVWIPKRRVLRIL